MFAAVNSLRVLSIDAVSDEHGIWLVLIGEEEVVGERSKYKHLTNLVPMLQNLLSPSPMFLVNKLACWSVVTLFSLV